ncbi:MBL fold metallo-hydrolase [Maridesulfovibrio salexigens]|uniref:Beta-lactamase domain protein n=1 Tax=Maridesulfovibrio salexigens (strain ATCC 14822 / DSM 2638 / NCIMB 8403 / VKM B-1763) TaxID=526222 RepID=C6C0V5_MARSD|nr:MBL fold metallo-hydrolase [Maridesulfovibrio salexigens]ACS81052.1 beta-lactamase domain protein [Maridesulfovibrio salexigens DSM 2638]
MKEIKVETFVLGPLETNSYLLSSGSEAVVIDCGMEPAPMLQAIRERELNVHSIYLTHMHLDHVGGVSALQKQTGATVYGNHNDLYLNDIPVKNGGSLEFKKLLDFEITDLKQGRKNILDNPVMIIETPGHTPGSLSYFFPAMGCIFVGDLLFMISVGRTDLPGGNSDELLSSIRNRIFILPGETQIFSGHGPMTTIKHEMRNNPLFV